MEGKGLDLEGLLLPRTALPPWLPKESQPWGGFQQALCTPDTMTFIPHEAMY